MSLPLSDPLDPKTVEAIRARWAGFAPEFDAAGVEDGAYQPARLYVREHGRTRYLASCLDPDAEKFAHASDDIAALLRHLAAVEAQRDEARRLGDMACRARDGYDEERRESYQAMCGWKGRAAAAEAELSRLRAMQTWLDSVDDPYEEFTGNGEACRFCFARRGRNHRDACVWQRTRPVQPATTGEKRA